MGKDGEWILECQFHTKQHLLGGETGGQGRLPALPEASPKTQLGKLPMTVVGKFVACFSLCIDGGSAWGGGCLPSSPYRRCCGGGVEEPKPSATAEEGWSIARKEPNRNIENMSQLTTGRINRHTITPASYDKAKADQDTRDSNQ